MSSDRVDRHVPAIATQWIEREMYEHTALLKAAKRDSMIIRDFEVNRDGDQQGRETYAVPGAAIT
jgi:hypothetical protein